VADKRLQSNGRTSTHNELDLAGLLGDLNLPLSQLEEQNREMRNAQELLEESRLRFQRLFHYAPVALFFVDSVGVIIEANQTAQEMFQAPNGLIGQRLSLLLVHQDRPGFSEQFHRALAGEETPVREFRGLRKQSRQFYTACRMCRWPLWENGQVRIMATFSDITSLKKTQAALIDSEARHRAILEAANDAILTTDDSEQILSVNPATERIFGYSPLELVGKPIALLFPESERERETACIRELLQGEKLDLSRGTHETFAHRKDGDLVPVEISLGRVKLGSRNLLTILIRDISERKRLEQQYLQSQKMEAIGQLAAGVAHDFNNLLTIINGGCEFVLMSEGVETSLRPLLDEIQKAGERAAGLTRQLLSFSRKQIAKPEPLVVADALRAIESMLRRMIGEHIELISEYSRSDAIVRIDRTQFEQILINLIVNSRDAIGPKGKIFLHLNTVSDPEPDPDFPELQDEYLQLTVTDTGEGMDEPTRKRLFEPFFTTKPSGKGTGLGLATVYGIVRQYRGRIQVESIPHAGTRFMIDLPLVPASSWTISRSEPATRSLYGTETILVAEDEIAVRSLIQTLLGEKGYRILTGEDVFDVLRVASQVEKIDLFITDVVMPHLSGREIAERLKPLHPETKILYISGYTDDEILLHGLEHSDLQLLQKPFGPQVLLEKVREVLDAGE
jgi:PAS domain S-box-containing protein